MKYNLCLKFEEQKTDFLFDKSVNVLEDKKLDNMKDNIKFFFTPTYLNIT